MQKNRAREIVQHWCIQQSRLDKNRVIADGYWQYVVQPVRPGQRDLLDTGSASALSLPLVRPVVDKRVKRPPTDL